MHKIIYKASELPLEWELIIGDNVFMSISFLNHLEVTQKRETEYHLFYARENKLDSIFVLFIYPDFPFFKNTILPFTKRIRMIYYPLPFSRSSMIIGSKTKMEVESVIRQIRGFTLISNVSKEELLNLPFQLSFARCTIYIKWNSMDAYLDALRSHYRYKYRKVLKQTSDLEIREIDSKDFTREMYRLYENVYEKTDLKINKAEYAFFQSEYSRIITISTSEKCVGFVQLINNEKELIFSLIGLDYDFSSKYNLYQRLLLEVINIGIGEGFEKIDLGQTTYDTKRKLGSSVEELYIQISHHNKFLLRLILLFRNVLLIKHDYSKSYHVFKEEGGKA